MNPTLSICIPTYNRPLQFERMVKGLLTQLTPEVEIIVRDDSPTLETQNCFNRIFQNKKILYQYFKGEKIGVDKASIFLLEKAQGDFVWFLSDDDELAPGAISEVIRLIKSDSSLDLIWANFKTGFNNSVALPNRPAGYFLNGSEIFETVGTGIGLISTQIYRRVIGLSGIEIAKKHIVGFSFVSTAIYIHVMTGPGRFYFLAGSSDGPYLICHPTTNSEVIEITTKTGKIVNEAFNVYGVNFYNVVREFESHFTHRSVRAILVKNFGALWRGMLVGWIGGWDTPVGKRWRMFKLYWSFPEFWIAMPAFLMPLWLNKFMYKFYKIFFHERKFIFFSKKKNSVRQGIL